MKIIPANFQYRDQGSIHDVESSSNLCVCVCSEDTAEFNQVNTALVSIFKSDAKGKTYSLLFFLPFAFCVLSEHVILIYVPC